MVKSVVRHDLFPKRDHIICQHTADIAAEDDIHIVCHPEIGDEDCEMVEVGLPFCACCRVAALHLFDKGLQRNPAVIGEHALRAIGIGTATLPQ